MILAGELEGLAAEYRATWSGLCRGKARTAYIKDAEDRVVLRSDFVRWLERRAAKNKEGGTMILQQIEERAGLDVPGETTWVLVFRGSDHGKTVERLVAEVVVELGSRDYTPGPGVQLAGVPGIAIRLAAFRHNASCVRRLGTLKTKFQKAMKDDLGVEWPVAYRYDRKRDEFYFGAQFVAWLRKEYLEKEPVRVPHN